MRILIVNTSDRVGGAAVAANRLMNALNKYGVKANMLVKTKTLKDSRIKAINNTLLLKLKFLWERVCIFLNLHFDKTNLFKIDIANTGTDITSLEVFKKADVINIAWINQAMLSLNNIQKIINTGKPVIWTMHDIWPATAICHLTLGCNNFKTKCKQCKYLPNGGNNKDLAAKVWSKKNKIYNGRGGADIFFVTCSKWLANETKQSKLINPNYVYNIPNPIDTEVFKKINKNIAAKALNLPTDKYLILFVAQRIDNENKGTKFLIEATNKIIQQNINLSKKLAMVILGANAQGIANAFNIPTYTPGYIEDTQKIVNVYNAADVFVLPSLSENLPNSIMEAMACGVPCVGFNVGGIPEEIDHKINGYVAKYKDAQDLAMGIMWVINNNKLLKLTNNAIKKVNREYSQRAVALKYIEIYNHALAMKKCKL